MSGGDGARAVCAGCGLLCDDLPLAAAPYRQGRPNVETRCDRGRRWFARTVFAAALEERRPTVEGSTVPLAAAASRAAALLAGAAHPRVAGLERLPLGAQRKLVEIADRTGADIDTGPTTAHLASVLATQRDGGAFLTLGELRERADCLVLWFSDPGRSHPRLLERFWPDGTDTGQGDGGGDRTLVAVGPHAGGTEADVALPVDPEDSLRLLWLVRLLADDSRCPEREEDPLGETAARLLEEIRRASCGAWLWAPSPGGEGSPAGDGRRVPGPVEVSGLLRLLERLNEEAPWGGRPLGGEGNRAGAEAVLTWQSGYPAAVSYRSGRPRYAGTAHAAGRQASEPDVLLAAGGPSTDLPSGDGRRCVWLDTGEREARPEGDGAGPDPGAATVRIPVLPAGARPGDTLLRTDGVSVRSPGIPGAESWDGPAAEVALDAVLGQLEEIGEGGEVP